MSKNKGKHEIPSELILYGLKWKSAFLEKWQGFDVKMYQNRQNSVKTFGLEDQYAIIFSLALWPQEPHEIVFFSKKLVFAKSVRSKMSKNVKIGTKWVQDGDGGLRFGLYG